MKLLYPIYGIAIIALYLVIANRGIEPFGASSERTQATPTTAGTAGTAGARGRGHSTFIWLGGYGGK